MTGPSPSTCAKCNGSGIVAGIEGEAIDCPACDGIGNQGGGAVNPTADFHIEYRVEFRHKGGRGRWWAVDAAVNRIYRDRAEAEQLAALLRTAHGELIECRVVSRRVTDWEPVGDDGQTA